MGTAVTMNSIRTGIITVLGESFTEIPVVGEDIEQGLEEPYFFIELVASSHTQELGNRYRRSQSFDIHYFGGSNQNMHHMAENLYGIMDLIEIDGIKYRGTNMTHSITDGVLHFLVNFTYLVRREVEEDELMQSMKQEECIKYG